MLQVSELYIYPVKSLGGIRVDSAVVTDRGFEYDRRWMLVDSSNHFFTQREYPQMALLQVNLASPGLMIVHKQHPSSTLFIPPVNEFSELSSVKVWSDQCKAAPVSCEADKWFSDMLGVMCKLVYMPGQTRRRVDNRYARNKEITSFSDGYPFTIIGQSSLDDLNNRLHEPLEINRFRPNIVFTGGAPYEEDLLTHFIIGGIQFYGVKRCARCLITTIEQDTATQGNEPLKTLASYRMKNNRVYFGQNLLHKGKGTIRTGDPITVVVKQPLDLSE